MGVINMTIVPFKSVRNEQGLLKTQEPPLDKLY